MPETKKKLVVFYCHHQAGTVQQFFPEGNSAGGLEVQKISLPCSGKLEVFHLIKTLENGADGVVLGGCPEGECRYLIGSQRAKGRVNYTRKILQGIGIEGERVRRFILQGHPSPKKEVEAWINKIKSLKPLRKDNT